MTVLVKRRPPGWQIPNYRSLLPHGSSWSAGNTGLVHKDLSGHKHNHDDISDWSHYKTHLNQDAYEHLTKCWEQMFWKEQRACPNPKHHSGVDEVTGEIIKIPNHWEDIDGVTHIDGCGYNRCLPCAHMNARKIARAVFLAEPTHWFSLTQVGFDVDEINRQMSLWTYNVRLDIPGFKCAWAAEPNPAGTGNHTHGYLHTGKDVVKRTKLLSTAEKAARRVGVGSELRMEPIPKDVNTAFFGYPMKMLSDPRLAQTFLDLNGRGTSRLLIHASRSGFWRDGRRGRQFKNRQEAEKVVLRRRHVSGAEARSPQTTLCLPRSPARAWRVLR